MDLVSCSSVGYLLGIVVILALNHSMKRDFAKAGRPLCTRCEYDLTGRVDAAQCPECGFGLDSEDAILVGEVPCIPAWVPLVIAFCFLVLFIWDNLE